jgi:hypothetical protein
VPMRFWFHGEGSMEEGGQEREGIREEID